MKKTVFVLILFCTLINILSCRDKETEKGSVEINEEVKNTDDKELVFVIEIEAIIDEDILVEILYKDYNNEKYSSKTTIKKRVKGSIDPQIIRFEIQNEIFPTSLRIDFGKNEKNKEIEQEIKFISLSMSFEDFKMKLTPQEFDAYFVSNKYIKFSNVTGIINLKSIDGKYDAYFDSKPLFKKKLDIEAR